MGIRTRAAFRKKTNKIIGILGFGNFGTALALLFSKKSKVLAWDYNKERVDQIANTRVNQYAMPNIPLNDQISITSHIDEVVKQSDILIFSVPTHAFREVCSRIEPMIEKKTILITASKGFELNTNMRMSKILLDFFPSFEILSLSGPCHAEEIARNMPTTAVLASRKRSVLRLCQEVLVTPSFRIYTNRDVKGVELCGSLKNIIAIANGISLGLGFGENTSAALITRGLYEMVKLGAKMGAKRETFFGLSGVGDLISTCNSPLSRNLRLGRLLAQNVKLKDALKEIKMVVEGVNATKVTYSLAKEYKIDMPITKAVYQVLFEEKNPKELVRELMERSLKSEDYALFNNRRRQFRKKKGDKEDQES